MPEKRKASSWYIAITHYLTAGLAMPLLIGLIAIFIIVPLIQPLIPSDSYKTAGPIISIVFRMIAVWLGVLYSAKFINKRYIIQDKKSVVLSATAILIVLSAGYALINGQGSINISNLIWDLISTAIAGILFYIFSQRFIKEDIEPPATQQSSNMPGPYSA